VAYDRKGHVIASGCGASDYESKLDMCRELRPCDTKRIWRVESERVLVGARRRPRPAAFKRPAPKHELCQVA
jgi:hypothetical protein